MEITDSLHRKLNNKQGLTHNVFLTPWGWMGVLASVSGIRILTLPQETRDLALFGLGDLSGSMLDKAGFRPLEEKLADYFNAKIVVFDEGTDFTGYTPFMQSVWQNARRVGYGQTSSYRDIAIRAGSPRAFRAAGQALKRNPVPIIIPCHRIIGSGGELRGFNSGVGLKKELLELEQSGLAKTAG